MTEHGTSTGWENLRNQRSREHNHVSVETAVVGDTAYLKTGHSYYDLASRSMTVVREGICKKATLCSNEGINYWVACDQCPMRSGKIPCRVCGSLR